MAKGKMMGADFEGDSGPDVDVDGLGSVRPMDEPLQAPEGFWARATEGWASPAALGFRPGRKKPAKPIEKPDYNIVEMFFKHIETEKGTKTLSLGERMKRSWALGRWVGDSAVNKLVDGVSNLWPQAKYGPDAVDILDDGKETIDNGKETIDNEKDQEEFEKEFAKENAKAEARENADTFSKMNSGEQETSPGGATRVTINPADTSHQVGSNRVGPDRQIRENTDPWPLDRPRADEAPERRALPQPPRALPQPPRQIADHRDEHEKGASKGAAAAERGRAAAKGLAERKGAGRALPKSSKSRDTGDMEI